MSESVDLTVALIGLESVTPDDAGCMGLIAERLAPLGFSAEYLDFADTRNLWLRRGSAAPLFMFLGHTDVVPPGPLDQWQSPPFAPTFRDGLLFGRGAADMKASIAAMTTALARFVEHHPDHPGSLGMLLTSDEEGAATHGVVKVIETFQARGEHIDLCLVGEPSSAERLGDVVRVGRRGSLCGTLTIHGIQGHVAYPDKADNPIHRFAPALAELAAETWDQGNEHFPPTRLQFSNIHAGTGAENVIPGSLSALLNFRFSTAVTADELKSRTEAILDRHGLRYQLDWRLSGNPFLTQGTRLIGAIQSALREITGEAARLDTGGGTSDGRFVAPTGAEVVELGPINASIHKLNEHVAVADIDRLSDIYEQVLRDLFVNR